MPDHFQTYDADDIDLLIALAASKNCVGHVEMLSAVRSGILSATELLDRGATPPICTIEKGRGPTLLVVNEDDRATGPAGWAVARRLSRWAKGAVVNAVGDCVRPYRAAIGMTLHYRRVLLIETDTAHAEDWGAPLARHMACTVLMPRDGGARAPTRQARSPAMTGISPLLAGPTMVVPTSQSRRCACSSGGEHEC
jgi:hypothetical protein